MKYFLILLFGAKTLFAFNVGMDPDWSSPPTLLSSPTVSASNPHVAMDSSGNVVAIWLEGSKLLAKSKPDAGSWGTTDTIAASGASEPQLIVDTTGKAYVIWNASGVIKVVNKPLGGSWSSATTLSSSSAANPTIAVNNTDDVVAAWVRSGHVETKTKFDGGSWPGLSDIILSANASNPKISVGGTSPDCTVILVWEATSGSINVIHSSTKLILTAWTLKVVISDISFDAKNPNVTVDENGTAYATWFEYNLVSSKYQNVLLHAAIKEQEMAWGASTAISSAGIGNPSNFVNKVASRGAQEVIAMWTIYNANSISQITSSVMTPSTGGFVEEAILSSGMHDYAFDLSLNSFYNIFVAYMYGNDNSTAITSTGLYIDGRRSLMWSPRASLASPGTNGNPSIAGTFSSSAGNKLVAAWEHYDGSFVLIHASTGLVAKVEPPTGLNVSQSSNSNPLFTEYYNTLTWVDSTSTDVEWYFIYRNGLFVKQIRSGVQVFEDHNRTLGSSDTYDIIAVDIDHFYSSTATIALMD